MKQKALTITTHYYVQSVSDYAVVGARRLIPKTNTKDNTRLFEVDSSHMTVSSQVKSFEFAQVDLRSTWGHFSFKWGHISWQQRLARLIITAQHTITFLCSMTESCPDALPVATMTHVGTGESWTQAHWVQVRHLKLNHCSPQFLKKLAKWFGGYFLMRQVDK